MLESFILSGGGFIKSWYLHKMPNFRLAWINIIDILRLLVFTDHDAYPLLQYGANIPGWNTNIGGCDMTNRKHKKTVLAHVPLVDSESFGGFWWCLPMPQCLSPLIEVAGNRRALKVLIGRRQPSTQWDKKWLRVRWWDGSFDHREQRWVKWHKWQVLANSHPLSPSSCCLAPGLRSRRSHRKHGPSPDMRLHQRYYRRYTLGGKGGFSVFKFSWYTPTFSFRKWEAGDFARHNFLYGKFQISPVKELWLWPQTLSSKTPRLDNALNWMDYSSL